MTKQWLAWIDHVQKIGRLGLLLLAATGCTSNEDQPDSQALDRSQVSGHPKNPARSPDQPSFKIPKTESLLVFRVQELPFQYERGETGNAWPSETTGGGVAILDYDGDGQLDLFFAQGGPLLPAKGQVPLADVLLRNLGNGQFEDISNRVGLTPKGHGQGVTAADYDGDGDCDIYVTRYGRNTLWRNDGSRFTDVTEQAGVGCTLWSLGAAFLDFDRDGYLDLFVANYFAFDPKQAPFGRDLKTGACALRDAS